MAKKRKYKKNVVKMLFKELGRFVKTVAIWFCVVIGLFMFLAGSSFNLVYNTEKVTKTFMDKVKDGIRIAKTVREVLP